MQYITVPISLISHIFTYCHVSCFLSVSRYFPDIFNASGGQANVKKYGDWFTYDKTPRALIFKRDHVKVKDLDSMTKLMR